MNNWQWSFKEFPDTLIERLLEKGLEVHLKKDNNKILLYTTKAVDKGVNNK